MFYNIKNCRNKIALLSIFSLVFVHAYAQEPKKPQSIDINSSYKPVLRNAVKINFNGSQLPADTSKPVLNYKIPSQNLFYAYSPISLKPLALEQDTNLYLGNRKFLKVGYGNFSTPYVSAGISLGDGKKSLLNITGNYISQKGSIVNFLLKNELYGALGVNVDNYYLFGYDHKMFNYKKDSIKQEFQNISLRLGYKNTAPNEVGINYNPNIELNVFTNKNKVNETDAVINLPFDKNINENFTAKVELKADITQYATRNITPANIKISNNIIQISPSVDYHDDVLKIHAGIIPAWNNKVYELMPDIYAEAQVKDKSFAVQAGWVGRLVKNSYKNLTSINPYLSPVFAQLNTKETEYYGGIKASIAKHFNFSAKAGLVRYKNLPFFINDTATNDNKSFKISNESAVNNFRIHGDVGYINQDKFSLTAGITFNGYTNFTNNDRAWHTMPVEIKSSLRWWAFKTVLIKSDLYVFDGSNYLAKGNKAVSMNGGTDLSAGVEIKINKNFSVWGDANNILNSKYERWHNYEVYGANFMGGILLNF
jgi:hypothetical protein